MVSFTVIRKFSRASCNSSNGLFVNENLEHKNIMKDIKLVHMILKYKRLIHQYCKNISQIKFSKYQPVLEFWFVFVYLSWHYENMSVILYWYLFWEPWPLTRIAQFIMHLNYKWGYQNYFFVFQKYLKNITLLPTVSFHECWYWHCDLYRWQFCNLIVYCLKHQWLELLNSPSNIWCLYSCNIGAWNFQVSIQY